MERRRTLPLVAWLVIVNLLRIQGCNVTLWPRVRFQHKFGAGPCFFRLPNRPSASSSSPGSSSSSLSADKDPHWIEIAFSSFQMGRLLNHSCPSGNLKIVEELDAEHSTLDGHSVVGTFCGRLADSQTYITSAKSVLLYANPSSEADHLNAYFDVLSTEALRKRYPELKATLASDGESDPDARCDVVLNDCPSVCRLTSPLYPASAYPRNVTCRYRVHFDRPDWQVVLGGQPGDKYDVSYHSHCLADRIVVYERPAGSQHYQQVAKFCGRGHFPKMIAQGGDVLVEMTSSGSGFFHPGFRLSVTHQRKRRSHNQSIVSPCHHFMSASSAGHPQGLILSPRHWFPRNVDCTWTLTAGRVWLEIHSKTKQASDTASSSSSSSSAAAAVAARSTCHHRLEVHRDAEHLMMCESNATKIHSLLVRDQVHVRFVSQRGSLSGAEMDFSVFYMFLPEEAPVMRDTLCDRVIDEPNGTVQLLGDRLLLRRKQLKCRVRFQAPDDYRIRVVVRHLIFDPIRQCESGDECAASNRLFDSLSFVDRDLLRCFCQSTINETVVDSASNRLDLVLDLKQIYDQSFKDLDIYRFQIDYAWIEDRCGSPIDDDQGGMIRWRSDSTNGSNQSCTWLIELPANDRILLKISATLGTDCRNNHFSLGYHGNGTRHAEKVCSMSGEFVSPFALRFLHVQVQTQLPAGRFLLKWNVLFRTPDHQYDDPALVVVSTGDDNFPCPDSNWSIPESLVCDGRINCPQHKLYGYLLDEDACTRDYYRDYYPWLMVLVVSFAFSVTISLASVSSHVRKWREMKTPAHD